MLLRIITSLLAGLVRSAPMPETVTVSGPGVSDHGKPNLVCFPTNGMDVVIFFLINYVVHASSVQTEAGASDFKTGVHRAQCLLNPANGVNHAIGAILRWSLRLTAKFPFVAFPPDSLTTAHRAGALVTARRTDKWAPQNSDKAFRAVKIVKNEGGTQDPEKPQQSGKDGAEKETPSPATKQPQTYRCRIAGDWEVDGLGSVWRPYNVEGSAGSLDDDSTVLGGFSLPPGYCWVRVPRNVVVEPLDTSASSPAAASTPAPASADDTGEPGSETRQQATPIELGAAYSVTQPLAAVVQTVSAGITLYRTRGDQIDRYGFAAFGLTVVPYLIMGIINFFAQIAIPKYRALFVVQSDILEEAIARSGHSNSLPVIVGKLPPGEHPTPGLLDVDLESDPAGPAGWRTLRCRGKPEVESILDTETIQVQTAASLEPHAKDGSQPRQEDYTGEIIVPLFPSVRRLAGATGAKRWRIVLFQYGQQYASILVGLLSLTVIGILTRFQLGTASRPSWRATFIVWLVWNTGNSIVTWIIAMPLVFLLRAIKGVAAASYIDVFVVLGILSANLMEIGIAVALWVMVGQQLMDYGDCTYFSES